MPAPHFDAKSKVIAEYYKNRDELARQGVVNEMGVREAFRELLQEAAKGFDLKLLMEQKLPGQRRVPDGTLRLQNMPNTPALDFGHWEAKDSKDNLLAEIAHKIKVGYPTHNIIFEDTRQAVLYQDRQYVGTYELKDPAHIAQLLTHFFAYKQPLIEDFKLAMTRFTELTPQLARGLKEKISEAHKDKDNTSFQQAFDAFMDQCRRDLNPRITLEQVDDMLIQHLLTERLIRILFQSDFADRNVIATEIKKVIKALASHSLSIETFLGQLDFFYKAIEDAAPSRTADFADKQTFLNDIYERFFQSYSFKVADTHGIVYTPQPIVEFMVALVEDALHREFGRGFDDPHVCVIDPCTGTGNFIVQLLRRMAMRSPDPQELKRFYQDRLFANEVMLLPYYIASLNIERTYYELMGSRDNYLPFEGLCFVDTLDLAEKRQTELGFITEQNAARVERQKRAPITVIIGNPPYNVRQQSENDNNKNRTYAEVEKRVRDTYGKDSKASNKSALSDPYVKFFRWASDRLGDRDGIVCYVSNNNFVDQIAFDGMRKHLMQDFTHVYHLDLHGNIRQNPKLSGLVNNVFGVQIGVGITIAVRSPRQEGRGLYYHRVPEMSKREEKLEFLMQITSSVVGATMQNVPQVFLVPDSRNTWRIPENGDEFISFLPIATKEGKATKSGEPQVIFKTFANGISTNRDEWVYAFDKPQLIEKVSAMVETYNSEIDRWRRAKRPQDIDTFVLNDPKLIKWSSRLKETFRREMYAEYDETKIRHAHYRPFVHKWLFFDYVLNHRQALWPKFLPTPETEQENRIISLSGLGHDTFSCLMVNHISDMKCPDNGNGLNQCFPFYTYDEDGSNRRENITDWALKQFQDHYADPTITKWDIFYYVYAALHSPAYRTKFAANLKRDLPRLPYHADFRAYANAGRQLADLHVDYESVSPYALTKVYDKSPQIVESERVKTMKLTKDKTGIIVNDRLTLTGIPLASHEYVLGSRSALAWIVDQYPAPGSDTAFLVDLIARVTAVSVQTVEIVKGL